MRVKICPKKFYTIINQKIIMVRVSEIYIEFVTSHDNKLNDKIFFLNMHFFKTVDFWHKKKCQSHPKNKIYAKKKRKNNLITLYSFIFLQKNGIFWCWPFSPCFYMESPWGKLFNYYSQLFQTSYTVCHWWTSFKVKIQFDKFCIGNGSYIDVHKCIWA